MTSNGLGSVRDPRADEYFDMLEPPMAEVARYLRQLLLELEPGLNEELKWGLPVYGRPENIISVIAHSRWVNLQLFNGAHLPDPENLLGGTGKNMRHVKLHSLEAAQAPAVKALIEACLKTPR